MWDEVTGRDQLPGRSRVDKLAPGPQVVAEAQSIAPVVCVQNFYNIAHRGDDDLIESLAAQGIAYVRIDVRGFIQANVTPFTGDAAFLAGPTERTSALWARLTAMFPDERARGVYDIDAHTPASITSHAPGYIDQEHELIVGLQTDAPLRRAIMPNGGLGMVEKGLAAYGYTLDPAVREMTCARAGSPSRRRRSSSTTSSSSSDRPLPAHPGVRRAVLRRPDLGHRVDRRDRPRRTPAGHPQQLPLPADPVQPRAGARAEPDGAVVTGATGRVQAVLRAGLHRHQLHSVRAGVPTV